MKGSQQIRFSALMADTVNTHGLMWAYEYYCKKHGMAFWEFCFWNGIPNGLTEQTWN